MAKALLNEENTEALKKICEASGINTVNQLLKLMIMNYGTDFIKKLNPNYVEGVKPAPSKIRVLREVEPVAAEEEEELSALDRFKTMTF